MVRRRVEGPSTDKVAVEAVHGQGSVGKEEEEEEEKEEGEEGEQEEEEEEEVRYCQLQTGEALPQPAAPRQRRREQHHGAKDDAKGFDERLILRLAVVRGGGDVPE